MITFVSENKDIILELHRKHSFFVPNQVICQLIFKNNLGIELESIKIPDYELINLIDNIYAFYEMNSDVIYSFRSCDNISGSTYSIGLHVNFQNGNKSISINEIQMIQSYYPEITLVLYKTYNESMNKILSFQVTDSLENLVELLYEFFIEEIVDEERRLSLLNL